MNSNTPLHIGEKIRQIRVAKGLSQDNLAYATGKSKAHISRLERGDSEIDDKTLAAIKEFLELPGAPLLEQELEVFRIRLWGWNELVSSRRTDEVIAQQKELSHITLLPFERELNMIYNLVAARIQIIQGNLDAAEEHLNATDDFASEASDDARALYNEIKGAYYGTIDDRKKSLEHYLKVLDFNESKQKQDAALLYCIGTCYSYLNDTIMALIYYERAKWAYNGDRTLQLAYLIDCSLASHYAVIGRFGKAIKLYESSLTHARSFNNLFIICNILTGMAHVYYQTGKYDECIKACDEALLLNTHDAKSQYIDSFKNAINIEVLLNKFNCMLALGDYNGCKNILSQADAFTGEDEELAMRVEAARQKMSLKDSKSTAYLESTAIPYLMAKGGTYVIPALDICDTLEALHLKRGAVRKADAIVRISRDVYKGIVYGPGGLEL